MTTNNFYEGCSKMATIFLMVLMEKKEPVPEILAIEGNNAQDYKIYTAD